MSTEQTGRLDAIHRYARSMALGARARGNGDEERRWLDLLINVDAARTAASADDGLRAGIEALAAKWEGWSSDLQPPLRPRNAAHDLRALLAAHDGSDGTGAT